MSWPGTDPYYDYNPTQGNARRTYYGLNWVPYMCIDGENDEGSTSVWESHVLSNAQTTAPLALSAAANFDYQSGLGSCLVTLDPETGDQRHLHTPPGFSPGWFVLGPSSGTR